MTTAPAERRDRYAHLTALDTRWMDNDAYGHVNNVVYYSFFDTAVNRWLIGQGVLDVAASPAIGLVVETQCRYLRPLTFPDRVTAGLRVAHVGRSSVRYELGLFRNDEPEAAAVGHFVHVYVDRATRRAVPVPDAVRSALAMLAMPDAPGAPPSDGGTAALA
jgi:acyl-CoA thioester hydrolase